MNTSFQKTTGSDEWATPWNVVTSLGPFDLDPCARKETTKADKFYSIDNDGLAQQWGGASMVQSSI